MTVVFNHSALKGTAKLILLGIANHDGDGGAWPSIDTLARYGGVSHRNAQKAVRAAMEAGEVTTFYQFGGTPDQPAHLRPNRYVILLRCPPGCSGYPRHDVREETGVGGDTPSRDRVSEATPPRCRERHPSGVASDTPPVSQATPKPSLEPSLEPSVEEGAAAPAPRATTGTRLSAFWTPGPELWERTRALAPDLDLEDELERFRDYWCAIPGARGRKLDWDGTWRNWVKRSAESAGSAPRRRATLRTAPDAESALLERMRGQA